MSAARRYETMMRRTIERDFNHPVDRGLVPFQ